MSAGLHVRCGVCVAAGTLTAVAVPVQQRCTTANAQVFGYTAVIAHAPWGSMASGQHTAQWLPVLVLHLDEQLVLPGHAQRVLRWQPDGQQQQCHSVTACGGCLPEEGVCRGSGKVS